ncbi:hypothetical protein O6H91_17G075200 [Diphasiastrum complanatum]|uniref:Uncharacterized protein n=2 Tax=Diphasiastrum complanatum TaxID=34168 RepID=A0ACC2B7Z9_DIPCM|nr:hypothetical protein O6H91_17G074600 [Diphasiastrum complanatum]KAJ7525949.1 hypothetical protein O6H91_17G075200 [Diphasiastrum complanatum]
MEIEIEELERPLLRTHNEELQEEPLVSHLPNRKAAIFIVIGFLATAIAIAAATGYLTKNDNPNRNIDLNSLQPYEQRIVDAENAAVTTNVEHCSNIGRNVLQDGGNAVDAAAATALCEGGLNSMASGSSGGAFLLPRLNDTVEA